LTAFVSFPLRESAVRDARCEKEDYIKTHADLLIIQYKSVKGKGEIFVISSEHWSSPNKGGRVVIASEPARRDK
jgi:hypothetical protein